MDKENLQLSAEKTRVLYLGLRPQKGSYHYPVIQTIKLAHPQQVLWKNFTHIIFTSQTTVKYWEGPWDLKLIAIGEATAKALPKPAIIAKEPTQEGIAKLIEKMQGSFFYPRSKRARPFLANFMKEKKIPFQAFDLYDTVIQKQEPVPNLDFFDEIIFTSPSTVEGFLAIYQKLPKNKKLTAIGPVTQKALNYQLF